MLYSKLEHKRAAHSDTRELEPNLISRKGDRAGIGTVNYVTHGDLLRLAQRRHCQGIHTEPVLPLCRVEKNSWVFKATVFKSPKCRGFVGYGDAHPGNVSPLIFNHAEMRMSETRAVNRALRKAYGI